MPERILKNCRLWWDGLDLSGQSNRVTFRAVQDMVEATKFGSSYRRRKPGLRSAEISAAGSWDATTGKYGISVDSVFWARLASSTGIFTVTEDDTTRANAYSANAAIAQYEPGMVIGELLSFTIAAQSVGGVGWGKVIRNTTVGTSAGLGVAVRPMGSTAGLGAARSQVYGVLHVIRGTSKAAHNSTLSIQCASSSGFGDATTFLKFDNVSTGLPHGQWKSTKPQGTNSTKVWYRMRWKNSTAAVQVNLRCAVVIK